MKWFALGMEPRRLWPVGYLNLADGLIVVRTDSPVANERLIQHLEMADRGPESRWWLDVLGAQWVILLESSGVPENMESVRVRGGMRLLRNRQATAVISVAHEPPRTDITLETNGRADEVVIEGNECRAVLDMARDGFVWVALPPVRGWRWMVDGARVELEQGPGIVQYVPMAAGRHLLVGRYRPPGFAAAGATSIAAMIVVVFSPREVPSSDDAGGRLTVGIDGEVRPFLRHPKDDVSMVGSMSLPNRQKQNRIWLLAALLPVGGVLFLVVMAPLLPRAPDLYVHLIWSWEVMRCLASGQLPVWLPDLNAGFGSPGIRLYSPLGPILTGGLGLVFGEAGRGLRAAALLAAGAVLLVPGIGRETVAGEKYPWAGLIVLLSPMVVFSLIGRAAWSEYLAIPLLWWVMERLLDGRIRVGRDGAVIAALWLMHAPSALMAGCLGAASLLLHRSRDHTVKLVQLAIVGGGLSAWHWLPLVPESRDLGGQDILTSGIFDPARNYLGSATAHAPHHNMWLGWVAVAILGSLLLSRSWKSHPHRTAAVVGCVVMASPLSLVLWRLQSPLQLLQFPWRWLLPATLLLVPALTDSRIRRWAGVVCLLVPSLFMTWVQWARVPALDSSQGWTEVGPVLYEALGANPLVVDAAQNRPPAFSDFRSNLRVFGDADAVVVSGAGTVEKIHRWSPLRRQVEVVGSTPVTVGFRVLDYPFWSVSTEVPGIGAASSVPGVVACRLPAGRHLVNIEWTGNPLSAVGQIVAALTMLGLVLRRRWPGGGGT